MTEQEFVGAMRLQVIYALYRTGQEVERAIADGKVDQFEEGEIYGTFVRHCTPVVHLFRDHLREMDFHLVVEELAQLYVEAKGDNE